MEDPQLAAMMVASAKKQAVENTRQHWNRNHHEHIVEATGEGKGKQRKEDPNASHLAMQASLLQEAAMQQEQRQSQNSSLNESTLWRFNQQQQQQQQDEQEQDRAPPSYRQDTAAARSDASTNFFASEFSNFSVPSTGVETTKASNVVLRPNHHSHYNNATASNLEASEVDSFFQSDFSVPSGGMASDILIRHSQDYYASPQHQPPQHLTEEEEDSSTLALGDSSMYPASSLDHSGATQQQQQQSPLKMVPMSANLVLPTINSSESSEEGMMLFTDRSPTKSPIANTNTTVFREEPLQFIDSPSRRLANQDGFSYTPTKYLNNTPTSKTPKMSNISATPPHQQSPGARSNASNIVYQTSSDDDQTFDDNVLLINRKNVSLSSEPLNDISRFEDESPPARADTESTREEQEFPISAKCSDWTRRNRSLLAMLIGILLVVSIAIIIRTVTSDNMAVQENQPSLADTIKINRTDDDDDFQIIIVNNTIDDDDDEDGDEVVTKFDTPEPTRDPTTPSPNQRPTTARPTRFPTARPTRFLTPFPTIDRFGFNREQFLFQVASEVSSASSLLDDSAPQYRALQWMINVDDPNILDPLVYLGKGNDIAYYEQVLDRYVMALLYFSTNGPNWRLQYNFLAPTSICEWNDGGAGSATEGVTCFSSPKGYEITEIILDVNSLDGIIPRELGHFSSLQKLTMGSNNLFGMIPTELGSLTDLQYLGLQRNFLIGSIPAQLGRLTKLTSLIVHDTGLNGQVPSTFAQLSNLSLLFLEATSLTGDLSPQFCNDQQIYQMFYANCRDERVSCSCCTHCCLEEGNGCARQAATARSDNDGVLN